MTTQPDDTVTLTWHQLRTLLESARNGDSVDDAMLTAEDMTAANTESGD